MSNRLSHEIGAHIAEAAQMYFRLILVVGPPRSGKTATLRDLATDQGWPLVNVNLALSERLLELTIRQRSLRVARIVDDIVSIHASEVVLIDNIEMLFHPDLRQDPLRLLHGISRNRTIVSTWRGTMDGRTLTYGRPDHPEYRRFDAPQAVIVVARPDELSVTEPHSATEQTA